MLFTFLEIDHGSFKRGPNAFEGTHKIVSLMIFGEKLIVDLKQLVAIDDFVVIQFSEEPAPIDTLLDVIMLVNVVEDGGYGAIDNLAAERGVGQFLDETGIVVGGDVLLLIDSNGQVLNNLLFVVLLLQHLLVLLFQEAKVAFYLDVLYFRAFHHVLPVAVV